jgi:hypothetical protein
MTIRIATATDTAAVMDLLRLMHAEIGRAPFSEKAVTRTIEACLDRGVIGLAVEDDKPVGAMGLVVEQPWYSEDLWLFERFTFVHPEHRRSRHARALLAFAGSAAAQAKMPILLGVFGDHRVVGKARLFGRHFAEAGRIYMGGP